MDSFSPFLLTGNTPAQDGTRCLAEEANRILDEISKMEERIKSRQKQLEDLELECNATREELLSASHQVTLHTIQRLTFEGHYSVVKSRSLILHSTGNDIAKRMQAAAHANLTLPSPFNTKLHVCLTHPQMCETEKTRKDLSVLKHKRLARRSKTTLQHAKKALSVLYLRAHLFDLTV